MVRASIPALVVWIGTTCRLGGQKPQIGWLVGFLERGSDVYYYALNIDITDNTHAAHRLPIVRAILRELELID